MKQRYYSIKDIVVGSYMGPVAMPNDNTAERALKIEANNPESFKGNKEDIELWYLFTMDSDTGKVVDNEPYLIGRLINYVGKKDE